MAKTFTIQEIAKQRRDSCMACPSLKGVKILVCKECGCPIVTKTLVPSAKCPLDKWAI